MARKRSKSDIEYGHAAVKQVPARILTLAGWIVGKIHVAEDWRMVDFLDHAQDFFALADVILEGRPKVIPLFTLQRSAILFIVVETDEELGPAMAARNQVNHSVSCLLENGTLFGRIEITQGVRLSDYLSRHSGFVLVRDCHFHLQNPWEDRAIDHRETAVLLNPQAVIGVSEAAHDE